MQVELKKGFRRTVNGEDVYIKDVELKRLSYGEMLDIQAKSEKFVRTDSGASMLVISETLLARNSLVAQIKRIGEDCAPFNHSILDDLDEEDGNLLMDLSARIAVSEAAEEMGKA